MAIVVLVFLQNWRSTIIPLTAVPVAIIGTFAVMAAIGFSLNNLTLFGLVLAIGIVVDDAIVVVEAVEHHIEEGMPPKQAAIKAMREVSGPVIAVALVLSAVFVPCAFISGITGQFFRQFALTIAVSTVISAFNSLTLSPALAALLLQGRSARKDVVGRSLDLSLGWFFRLFNWAFRRAPASTRAWSAWPLRGSVLVLLVYGGLLRLTSGGPRPDCRPATSRCRTRANCYAAIQLPDSASLERTQAVVDRVTEICQTRAASIHTTVGRRPVVLARRQRLQLRQPVHHARRLRQAARPGALQRPASPPAAKEIAKEVPEAIVTILGPPAVSGLGSAGGFKFMVEDRSGNGDLMNLQTQTNRLDRRRPERPETAGTLLTVFRADSPQLYVDLDRKQCQTMGVNPQDVFTTLQVYLGSLYVNDFNDFGRTWQVVVQAEGRFRNDLAAVKRLRVRNAGGGMVPLGDVLDVRPSGPLILSRYNMYPAAAIVGNTKPGVSSGEGIIEMERLAKQTLPQGMSYEWTEINFIQVDAAKNVWNNLIFPLAVAFVFLVLAAQYESWALPLAVILVVPMCLLGWLTGVWLSNRSADASQTSTSSRRSASWCWSAWPARTRS